MNFESKKRPPRTPLTAEELSDFLYLRKVREHKKLIRFKKSFIYKFSNIINIVAFFIYCELICCFFGPASYQTHYIQQFWIEYGETLPGRPDRIIDAITIKGVNNKMYKVVVKDYVAIPKRYSSFEVGSDFLLRKEIKSRLNVNGAIYKLEKASPILFLSVLVGIFSLIVFFFDLNQNPHSLGAITCINILTVIAFSII
jgi:hypothetical protein